MVDQKGFTILEITVAIFLLGIISFMSISILSDFQNKQNLKNTTENIVSLLNEARAKTLAGEGGEYFSVLFEEKEATLFSGEYPIGSDPFLKEISFEKGIQLDNLNLNSGSDKVVFIKLSGDTLDFGSITFSVIDDLSQKKTINILKTGIIDIE